jgi:AcrR family transcriptional regulator
VVRKARMNQEARSERSRAQILEAALRLFSSRGYHGTSMRDIAREAKVSTGNVYHQFPDKESLFKTLLDQYWTALDSPEFPFNKALAAGAFPDDLAALARAARESVEQYRDYVSLIYVDVVEFDGSHIRKFYSDMARRFEVFLAQHRDRIALDRLREGVHPLPAIMVASRFFLQYFAVEILFGVPNHFGRDTETALRQIVDILEFGMLKPELASGAARPSPVPERGGAMAAADGERSGPAPEGSGPASPDGGPVAGEAAWFASSEDARGSGGRRAERPDAPGAGLLAPGADLQGGPPPGEPAPHDVGKPTGERAPGGSEHGAAAAPPDRSGTGEQGRPPVPGRPG